MGKREIATLLNTMVEHKHFGQCKVIDIIDQVSGKIVIELAKSKEIKKVVFSKQYFYCIDDYKTVDHEIKNTISKKRVYKKTDVKKYRNHPLVQEINRKEDVYLSAVKKQKEKENAKFKNSIIKK